MEIYEVKVYSNGSKSWFKNDKLHRLDGPAFEYTNGDKFWYQKGQLHRLDGPAIELADGTKYWFIEGKEHTEQEFNIEIEKLSGIITINGVKYKKI